MRDAFDRRENISYYVRHFGDALRLRRNNPRVLPEAYELADEVLQSCGLPGDAIVDADSPAYQDPGGYELEELTSRGYTSLLHFERGRVAHRAEAAARAGAVGRAGREGEQARLLGDEPAVVAQLRGEEARSEVQGVAVEHLGEARGHADGRVRAPHRAR